MKNRIFIVGLLKIAYSFWIASPSLSAMCSEDLKTQIFAILANVVSVSMLMYGLHDINRTTGKGGLFGISSDIKDEDDNTPPKRFDT